MRRLMTAVVVLLVTSWACSSAPEPEASTLPNWSFDQSMLFPVDRSLVRPEDGVALADGRLVVADQEYGLRAIAPDGSSRPFGQFTEAGYVHEPPARAGAPNGVSLEPDGTHVLVADVFTGAIYRVNVASEATELVYQHPFGVNAARTDSTGAVWFTQSTENAGADSEARLFATVDIPLADGALFRIPPAAAGEPRSEAALVVGDLYFANGFAIDEERGRLYLSETVRDRVLDFRLSLETGELTDRRVLLDVATPDNLELDGEGRLWVVSPIRSEIVVVDPPTGESESVFRPVNPDSDRMAAEWTRRGAAGEPRLDLMVPELWAPLPGLVTGLILTPGDGPVYLAGLGDALVRLDR
jgi:sugar lactone lactonase YvrE